MEFQKLSETLLNKIQPLKTRVKKIDKLHNLLIDDKLQSLIKPLHLILTVQLLPKYTIKHNFISTTGIISKIATLFGVILRILPFLCRIFLDFFGNASYEFVILIIFVDGSFYCFGLIIVGLFNIFLTKVSVQCILKTHDIHKLLYDKSIFKYFVFFNWLFICVIFIIYLIDTTINFHLDTPMFITVCNVMLFCVDANMIYSIRFVNMLECYASSWNNKMLSPPASKVKYERMCNVYNDILKSYKLFVKSSQHWVCVSCIFLKYEFFISVNEKKQGGIIKCFQ